MKKQRPLHLYEEILLLALHDEKGTVHFGASFDQAAGGAILAELLLSGRIAVEGKKSKAKILLKDRSGTGEQLLDECLAQIADRKKPMKPAECVMKFATVKRLRHRIADRMVEMGILGQEQDKVLLLFNRTIYPEVDGSPEREITNRIHQAIVGSTMDISARTVVLIALAKHTGLLQHAVEKRKLKENKRQVEKIIAGEVAGVATGEAMEAVQAAVMVAVMVPMIATSATS
jgi:hypothetical protein